MSFAGGSRRHAQGRKRLLGRFGASQFEGSVAKSWRGERRAWSGYGRKVLRFIGKFRSQLRRASTGVNEEALKAQGLLEAISRRSVLGNCSFLIFRKWTDDSWERRGQWVRQKKEALHTFYVRERNIGVLAG